jgi:hypothetical protein
MQNKIEKWQKKMTKLLKDCPEGHWLFAANGGLYLMRFDDSGNKIILPNGSMDQDAIVGSIMKTKTEIDGGDW